MNRAMKLLHNVRRKPKSSAALRRLIAHHRQLVKQMTGLNVKVNDEASFFSLLVLHQSLTNKQAFETSFERTRKELSDLWDTLDRQEKNFLANQKLDLIKRRLNAFQDSSGNTIWMACFDDLLNALYDKRISIFELDQYYKLYTSFTDRMMPVERYGLAPLTQHYIEVDLLDDAGESILIYYGPLHSLFRVQMSSQNMYAIESIPLDPHLKNPFDVYKDWTTLHTAMRSDQSELLIDCLSETPLLEPRRLKQLLRLRKKRP